ncbi:growth-blocking peptide, long form-like [Zerene cesonia]|uniref:growth-blocking peptide, long form-like n=1 Tax=Zerene cesonia TaxID=33412 RepID=UPI0018E5149C|nr:growth-blocking peptide, long form-like [Zerene cesonia]
MKRFNLLFCLCLIFCCALSNAGLLRDIAESLHEKSHKIRDDIRGVLHPNKEGPRNEITTSTTSAAPQPEVNTIEKVSTSEMPIVFPNTDTETIKYSTVKSDVIESPSTVVSISTTEKKDGRENFGGGCSTGFKRTADGRCLPTF